MKLKQCGIVMTGICEALDDMQALTGPSGLAYLAMLEAMNHETTRRIGICMGAMNNEGVRRWNVAREVEHRYPHQTDAFRAHVTEAWLHEPTENYKPKTA